MRLKLSPDALASVASASPNQTWAFVCDSYRKDATVVEVHISYEAATRAARKIGGCKRVGHVEGDYAVTL